MLVPFSNVDIALYTKEPSNRWFPPCWKMETLTLSSWKKFRILYRMWWSWLRGRLQYVYYSQNKKCFIRQVVIIFLFLRLEFWVARQIPFTCIKSSYAVWIFCLTAGLVVKSIIASMWFSVIITRCLGFLQISIWCLVAITIKSYNWKQNNVIIS